MNSGAARAVYDVGDADTQGDSNIFGTANAIVCVASQGGIDANSLRSVSGSSTINSSSP